MEHVELEEILPGRNEGGVVVTSQAKQVVRVYIKDAPSIAEQLPLLEDAFVPSEFGAVVEDIPLFRVPL